MTDKIIKMPTQITLPCEVVEHLVDQLASRCGTNADEWPLINKVRAALTDQVQPAQGVVFPVPTGRIGTNGAIVLESEIENLIKINPQAKQWLEMPALYTADQLRQAIADAVAKARNE